MLKSKKSFYKFITNSLVVNKELAKQNRIVLN